MARGTSDYTRESPIPGAVADAIFPAIEALSKEGLLSRCLHGTSQNKNKAINVSHLAMSNKRNSCQHTNSRTGDFLSSWLLQKWGPNTSSSLEKLLLVVTAGKLVGSLTMTELVIRVDKSRDPSKKR